MMLEPRHLPRRPPGVRARRTLRAVDVALAALLTMFAARHALAQVALPEQRVPIANFTGMPSCSAAGLTSAVTGFVLKEEPQPYVAIRVAYAPTPAVDWRAATGLPEPPPTIALLAPVEIRLMPSGGARLVANSDDVYFYASDAPSPFSWHGFQRVLFPRLSASTGYDFTDIEWEDQSSTTLIVGSENSYDGVARLLVTRSVDNGTTWSFPVQVGTNAVKGGSLAVGPLGEVYLSSVDYARGQAMCARSLDGGTSFSTPVPVADMMDNLASRPPGWKSPSDAALVSPRQYPVYLGGNLFAANFPGIAVDRSAGPRRGRVYMVWAEHSSGAPAAALDEVFETEPNDTPAQAAPLTLDIDVVGILEDVHRVTSPDYYRLDLTQGETVWIGGECFQHSRPWVLEMEAADGRLQIIENQALKAPIEVAITGQPKATIFTAPRTGRYYLHISPGLGATGYQLSVRHWLPSSSTVALDARDIVLVHSDDGGQTWSPKQRVNHGPAGSDQAMPNVAVDGQGRVYVGWYDWRDAVDGDGMNAYAAVSSDGGDTFGPDLRLSRENSRLLTGATPDGFFLAGHMIGDRIAVSAGESHGVVAWTDLRRWPAGSDIYAATIVDIPTATDAVSDLSVEPLVSGVRLRWLVNDARAVTGLRVYRSEDGGAELAQGAGEMLPAGNGRAELLDAGAEPRHTYEYRLRIVTGTGTHWLGPVAVTVPERITSLAWRAAWPNPFARRTSVKLVVPRAAEGSVRVYDVQGKQVKTLALGAFEPGERTIEWDGHDASGGIAAPGLYFVSAQVGSETVRLRVARVP